MYTQIEKNGNINILKINRPPVNAINLQMVLEITDHLKDLKTNTTVSGVILTGVDGYFSAGLDVIDLFPRPEEDIRMFWTKFYDLMQLLYTFPKPLFSAISGHSPAGGTVMAIMTDYRLMAMGEFTIGLNEVSVGLVIPQVIAEIFSRLIGSREAELMALNGSLITPEDALGIDLVDELCPAEDLLSRSMEKMELWLKLPPIQQMMTKEQFRRKIVKRMLATRQENLDQLMTIWFSKPFQIAMGNLVENLTAV